MIITRETAASIEAAFTVNGRRLEEYVALHNGDAVAIVSSVMSDWQNKDLLLRGGPDFANVAFLAYDPKGYDRSEMILTGPQPRHGGPLLLEELWGNHVSASYTLPPGTGGPDGVRSAHRRRNATQRDLIRQNATATAGEAWQIVRATFAAVADSPLDLRRLVLRLVHSRHEISDCVVYGFAHLR